MRILLIAIGLCVAATAASAQWGQGGCRGSGMSCGKLNYYCSLGSQTPYSIRKYCGPRKWRQQRGYDGGRLSDRELRYYCSLGKETPYSVRDDCVRAGYW